MFDSTRSISSSTSRRSRVCATRLAAPIATALAATLLSVTAVHAFNDLATLSDEFDNPATLGQWQRIHIVEGWHADQLETYQMDTTGSGALVLMPYASTWFEDYRGLLAFKPINGDFVATADIEVSDRAESGPPNSQFYLAGIMLRTPRPDVTSPADWTPGGENHVFLSLGAATVPGSYEYESKTTVDSNSTLDVSPGVARAEIRMARIANAVISLRRPAGVDWVVHQRFDRPDIPQDVQVGMIAYTDWQTVSGIDPFVHNQTIIGSGNPDLVARFDYLRFARPAVPPGLTGVDLTDDTLVTDEQLLAFLGDSADAATDQRLDLQARYEPATSTLILDFALRPEEPVTWNLGLTIGSGFVPLFSLPLPALADTVELSLPLADFPALGRFAVWSTYTTAGGQVVGEEMVPVDTN